MSAQVEVELTESGKLLDTASIQTFAKHCFWEGKDIAEGKCDTWDFPRFDPPMSCHLTHVVGDSWHAIIGAKNEVTRAARCTQHHRDN
jgi:hypothetical protein